MYINLGDLTMKFCTDAIEEKLQRIDNCADEQHTKDMLFYTFIINDEKLLVKWINHVYENYTKWSESSTTTPISIVDEFHGEFDLSKMACTGNDFKPLKG